MTIPQREDLSGSPPRHPWRRALLLVPAVLLFATGTAVLEARPAEPATTQAPETQSPGEPDETLDGDPVEGMNPLISDPLTFLLEAGGEPEPAEAVRPREDPPLVAAARRGDVREVQRLLAAGVDVDAPGQHGRTALMWLASRGLGTALGALLVAGADPDRGDDSGSTALFFLPPDGGLEVAEALLAVGATVDAVDSAGRTPLHAAAFLGDLPVVRRFLERGAPVDGLSGEALPGGAHHSGAHHGGTLKTPLAEALLQAELSTAEALLEAGAGRDVALEGGEYLLHRLAEKGRATAVTLLLKHGATAGVRSRDGCCPGETPLGTAARAGHADVVGALLAGGLSPELFDETGFAALHRAADGGHEAVVVRLLAADASVDLPSRDEVGGTALLKAARKGYTAVVDRLLEGGASVGARTRSGVSALMYASYYGDAPLARKLLERGAEIDAANEDGNTPLLYAVVRRHPSAVSLLLEAGADTRTVATIEGFGRVTPLMLAAGRGHQRITRLLLTAGAPVDTFCEVKGFGRVTPLMVAAERGFREIVEALLASGADPTLAEPPAASALERARAAGDETISRLLEEAASSRSPNS